LRFRVEGSSGLGFSIEDPGWFGVKFWDSGSRVFRGKVLGFREWWSVYMPACSALLTSSSARTSSSSTDSSLERLESGDTPGSALSRTHLQARVPKRNSNSNKLHVLSGRLLQSLSGRLEFTVRRHTFNTDSRSRPTDGWTTLEASANPAG